MSTLSLFPIALITLAAAVYAQWRIPFHTATSRHALISRLILIAVGLAFGYVAATVYTQAQGGQWLLAFLAGFGLVHVPAAAILFFKRQRARG